MMEHCGKGADMWHMLTGKFKKQSMWWNSGQFRWGFSVEKTNTVIFTRKRNLLEVGQEGTPKSECVYVSGGNV